MRQVRDEVIFNSGRKLYTSNGSIGIDHNGELYYGFDGNIHWPDPEELNHGDNLSVRDMEELADEMIERWQFFKKGLRP